MSEVVFFFSYKNMSGMKLKKIAYCSSLPHFFFPSMQEVVAEAILPNTFSKIV